MKQKLPLPALAAGMSHLERGAWREADEVQLVVHEARPVVAGRKLGRQHCETGRQRERALAGAPDLELWQVGAGDAGVAADVDEVDPIYVFPKVIDRPRDDAARDQRLPQADLVGDEEAGRAVCLQEQAPECVVDGAALEGLQRFQDFVDIRAPLRIRDLTEDDWLNGLWPSAAMLAPEFPGVSRAPIELSPLQDRAQAISYSEYCHTAAARRSSWTRRRML